LTHIPAVRILRARYQQEERRDDFPADSPVNAGTKTQHLMYVFAELIQAYKDNDDKYYYYYY